MKMSGNRVLAKGFHNGNEISIECIETNKGVDILIEGDNKDYIEFLLKKKMIQNDLDGEDASHSYHPDISSIEAYWLVLHELEDYFDSELEIKVIGDIDIKGSPYDESDDLDVIY